MDMADISLGSAAMSGLTSLKQVADLLCAETVVRHACAEVVAEFPTNR